MARAKSDLWLHERAYRSEYVPQIMYTVPHMLSRFQENNWKMTHLLYVRALWQISHFATSQGPV